jgi:hypothetical protein
MEVGGELRAVKYRKIMPSLRFELRPSIPQPVAIPAVIPAASLEWQDDD